jgi:glycerol-3-phosphate dehydrogenase (NAD(P)+)
LRLVSPVAYGLTAWWTETRPIIARHLPPSEALENETMADQRLELGAVVLNAGGWGTALAVLLARGGRPVTLWTRRAGAAERLRVDRENRAYLAGIEIPPRVEITSDLAAALRGGGVIVVAVISSFIRQVACQMAPLVNPNALIVHGTKGFEADTLLRCSEVLEQELGPSVRGRVAVLSGPTHAEEVARGVPTAAVLACPETTAAVSLQSLLSGPSFRVYTNPDRIGVEVCGSLKNVIAIAAGASDGLGYGDNAKAALVTRGLAEMSRLVAALGGQASTPSGLAGLGDVVATCASRYSRNRWAGEQLGRGRSLDDIVASTDMVIEGIPATRAAAALAARAGVELPITEQVHAVLFDGRRPSDALAALMAREPTSEG